MASHNDIQKLCMLASWSENQAAINRCFSACWSTLRPKKLDIADGSASCQSEQSKLNWSDVF